jgi:sec-independent protein translocase protein TatC
MAKKEYSYLDHLDEVRKRLIIIAVAFLIFLVIGFVYTKQIYNFFMGGLGYKLMILGPSDIMWIYFHIATIFGAACTVPVLVWQIWAFIKPALKPFERKSALGYIPAMFFLFLGGLSFGYFVIFPNIMRFLLKMGQGLMTNSFTADKYLSFLLNMTLPFGVAFEMPVVMMLLTTLGFVNPYKVTKLRKIAYLLLVIVASMISPPELMSHISVAIPLIMLFEISVVSAKVVYKKKQRRLALEMKNAEEFGELLN